MLTEDGGTPCLDGRDFPETLFARAARQPDHVAVAEDGRTLTYAELAGRARELAARLRGFGLPAESPVAVCLPPGADLVVSMVAVMAAGCAYTPVDPGSPEAHRDAMLDRAGATVMLTDATGGTTSRTARRIVDVRRDRAGTPGLEPAAHPDPRGLAYVVHTSGSTGQAKAVMVAHGSFLSHLRGWIERWRFGPEDRTIMTYSPAFDVSVELMGATLLAGGTLVVPDGGRTDPADLPDRIRDHAITRLDLTPAYLRETLATLDTPDPRLRGLVQLLVAGDTLLFGDLQRWAAAAPGVRMVCGYGTTEMTVTAMAFDVPPGVLHERAPSDTVPIGRPLHDCRAHALDPGLRRVTGADAELYVSGGRLARGYLGRPDLTAERFVPDPFAPEPGARMYRTGDRVRMAEDGTVEFLGRTDRQLKIRGFRVEPGEVEAVLTGLPGVQDACVLPSGEGAERQLTAHVATAADGAAPTVRELADTLRAWLPEYMVPARWALHAALPRTTGGKIDRAALAGCPAHAPRAGEPPEDAGEPLEGHVRARVARIWSRALGVEEIGASDDFFVIGGNSLLAARVRLSIQEEFGVDLPLRTLFEASTVAELGSRILRAVGDEVAALSDEDVERIAE